MKTHFTRTLRRAIFAFYLIASIPRLLYAQCGAESITITDWCENTYAKWEFDTPTPDASYIWYGYVDPSTLVPVDFDASGVLIPTAGLPKYDSTNATDFYTPFRVKQAIDGNFVNLTYQKIIHSDAVPYGTPTLTSKPVNSVFEVDFDLTEDIRLNTVKIPVKLNSPTALYKIQVAFGSLSGTGSAVYEFSGISAQQISGDNYLVEVPVDINLIAGTGQKLVINTNPTGSTAAQVDGVLFSNTQITTGVDGPFTFGANAATTNGGVHSVIYDWDYTIVCEPLNSGVANLTTVGCCVVPPSAGILVVTTDKDIIKDQGTTFATISATGGLATSYYAWYLDGVLQTSLSGVNKTTISTNTTGVYEVREITDPTRVATDLDNPGCYSFNSVTVQDQLIDLTIDVAPTNNPICLGDEYELSATGSSNLTWKATNGVLTNTTGSTTKYSGTGIGSGIVEVTGTASSNNLLVDGDFTTGNTSNFFTEYSVVTNPASTDGGLTITNDGLQFNNTDWNLAQPTIYPDFKGNTGNFLLVNDGRYADNKPLIWGQKTTSGVLAGETYTVSFDMTSLSWIISEVTDYSNILAGNIGTNFQDVAIEVFVNGQSVGIANTDFATNGYNSVHNWKNYSFNWVAPTDLNDVSVELRMTTPSGSGFGSIRGYDFGIDNIYFGGLVSQTISVGVGPYTDCSSMTAIQGACVGDEKTITALPQGGMVFSHWEDPSGTKIATTASTIVAPVTPTTYTAVGYTALGNVLNNGSFQNGATGFTSGGIYYKNGGTSISGTQEEFIITNNSVAGNSGAWIDVGPRPGSSDTEFLVADAKTNEPIIAWTFTATAGQAFQFEGWAAQNHKHIANPSSSLASHIGVSIIPSTSTPSTTDPLLFDVNMARNNNWNQLKSAWTAPSDGTYTFYIRNLQTSNGGGNDIVLDDFELKPLINNSETRVDILVQNCACDGIDTLFGTYCGTKGTFTIKDNYTAPGGTYDWYNDSLVGSMVSGTTGGTYPIVEFEATLTDAKGPIGVDKVYTLYVEDNTILTGEIAKTGDLCNSTFSSSTNYNELYTRLKIYEDVSLTNLDVILANQQEQFKNWLTPPVWETYSGTVKVGVYSAKLDNGKMVPDALIKSETINYSFTQKGNYTYTVPFDYDFSGSKTGEYYFLGLVANSKTGSGNFQAAFNNCTDALPLVDDLTGTTAEIDGSVSNGNEKKHIGFVHNIGLAKKPNPACPRIPVQLAENCPPCNKPKTVTIPNTTATKLCEGDKLDVAGFYDPNGLTPNNTNYYYSWHYLDANGTRTPLTTATIAGNTGAITNVIDYEVLSTVSTDSGKYILRVEDGNLDDATCYTEDTVSIEVNKMPDLSITTPSALCSPKTADLTKGVWADTKNTNATITYHTGLPTSSSNLVADPTKVGDGTYHIKADNQTCVDEEKVVITVNTTPSLTATDPTAVCDPTKVDITGVWSDANATTPTVSFYKGVPSSLTSISATAAASLSNSGTYYIVGENNGCTDTTNVKVTINSLPTPEIGNDTTSMCEGETRVFTNVNHTTGSTYTWTVTGTGVTFTASTSENISVTAGTADITLSLIEKNANGCTNAIVEIQKIKVDQKPSTADAGADLNVCIADPVTMPATSPTIGTGVWTYAPSSTITTAIDDLTKNNSNVSGLGSTDVLVAIWTVTNGVCQADDDTVTITAKGIAAPTVSISASSQLVCEGTQVTVTASGNNGGTLSEYQFFDNVAGNSVQAASNTNTFTFTATQDTVIEVEFSSNSSCLGTNPSKVRANVSITVVPEPSTSNIVETNFSTCQAEATLSSDALVEGTGVWSIQSGDVGSVDASGKVIGLVAGKTTRVYYTVSTGSSCPEKVDSVDINRLAELSTVEAGSPQTLCETDATTTPPILTGSTFDSTNETADWSANGPATIDATTGQTAGLVVGENKFYYTIKNAQCNEKDSVTITVDAIPTNVGVTSSSVVTCDNQFKLSALTPVPSTAVGIWGNIVADAGSPSIPTADVNKVDATISGLEVGKTKVDWKVTNGKCTATPVTVTIEKKGTPTTPTITINGANYTNTDVSNGKAFLCDANTYTVTGATPAKTGETGVWSVEKAGGASVTTNSTEVQSVAISGANETVLRWTIDPNVAGCSAIFREVTLDISTTPEKADVGGVTQLPVCGDKGTLPGVLVSAPTVGTWEVVSGTVTDVTGSNNATQAFTGLTENTVVRWVTSTGGVCPDDSVDVQLIFSQPIDPEVSIVQTPSPVCAITGNMVTYTATPIKKTGVGEEYIFYVDGSIVQALSTSNTYTVASTGINNNQTVSVALHDKGSCFVTSHIDFDSVKAVIQPENKIKINETNVSVCEGTNVTLEVADTNNGNLQWYSLTDGKLNGQTSNTLSVTKTDVYYATSDDGICPVVQSPQALVKIVDKPVISMPDPIVMYTEEDYQVSGVNVIAYDSLQWSPTGIDIADNELNEMNPLLETNVTSGGKTIYTLTAYNGNCSTTGSLVVNVYKKIKVPNVFTPNNDGENEFWVIDGLETYENCLLKVYNRWGMIVHTDSGVYEPWDGKDDKNGRLLPAATYYWVIDRGNGEEPQSGVICIIR